MRNLLPLTLLFAMAATPAMAQDTDSQMMTALSAPYPSKPADTHFTQAFGLCVASKDRRAERVLHALPGSSESDKSLFYSVLSGNACGPDMGYAFNARALRGPVAEYFLKRDVDLNTWQPKGRLLAVFPMPTVGDLQSAPAETRQGLLTLVIGGCLFDADHADTGTLLRTAVGSTEESAAFASMMPHLSHCVPAGSQLRLTKFQLRGALAEAAYRAVAASKASH